MNKQRTQGFTWFSQIRPTSTGGGLELLHYNGEKPERIIQGVLRILEAKSVSKVVC